VPDDVLTARRNAPVWATYVLVAAGVLLLLAGAAYWFVPSQSLPTFVPGYKADSLRHHHGHALLLVALAANALLGAWQTTGYRCPRPADS
jgi:hypothetical protein